MMTKKELDEFLGFFKKKHPQIHEDLIMDIALVLGVLIGNFAAREAQYNVLVKLASATIECYAENSFHKEEDIEDEAA